MIPSDWYLQPFNFPALITCDAGAFVVVHYYKDNYVFDMRDNKYQITGSTNWKLTTKTQLLSLHHID